MTRPMIWALWTASAALILLSQQVQAQANSFSSSVLGHDFQPAYSTRNVSIMTRTLRLTRQDKAAVLQLLDAYLADHAEDARKHRESNRDTAEQAEIEQRPELLSRSRAESEQRWQRAGQRDKQLIDDIKAVITKEQLERWPAYEREVRRSGLFYDCWMSGERADVADLVTTVDEGAAESPPITEILDAYAAESERALLARDKFMRALPVDAYALPQTDPQRARSLRNESVRIRMHIRDVNRRYLDKVAAELHEPARTKLQDAFVEKCMPWGSRPSYAHEYLKRTVSVLASSNHGKPGRAAGVAAETLLREYEQENRALNSRFIEAFQKWEETFVPPMLAAALDPSVMQPQEIQYPEVILTSAPDSPLGRVRSDRLRTDREFRTKARQLLTPEQHAQIDAQIDGDVRFWTFGHTVLY